MYNVQFSYILLCIIQIITQNHKNFEYQFLENPNKFIHG